jgi:AraC-like DNA-binding protein
MAWNRSVGGSRTQLFATETTVLWSGSNPGGLARVPLGRGFSTVRIDVHPRLLVEWLGDERDAFGSELQQLLQPDGMPELMLLKPASPHVAAIARVLLESPMDSSIERIHFESRVLELLAAFLEPYRSRDRAAALSQADAQRVRAARELVEQRMADPPALHELARLVGTNEYTLKRGFKTLYGRPVFRWLHELRLERGRELLRCGQHTVTEVALELGFAKPSWFAQVFRARYGVTPKAYALSCRQVPQTTEA